MTRHGRQSSACLARRVTDPTYEAAIFRLDNMKQPNAEEPEDLRLEYDLTTLLKEGVRGKYAARYRGGAIIVPLGPDGSQAPQAAENEADLALAAAYAPILLFDAAEPFLPLSVGVTVLRTEADSPSFPRRISREFTPPWEAAIEYAIWWDWDIGHLYELEHVWSYVGADGELVWAEGSWHGAFSSMILAGGRLAAEGSRPLLLSQPGKHAFAPEQVCMDRILPLAVHEAARVPGKDGVLVKERYASAIRLQAGDHERAASYLRPKAFLPTMRFTQRFEVSRELLVPWPVLDEWIPARVNWWLEQLRAADA